MAQQGKRLTPEERARIRDLWRDGLGVTAIATEIGRHRETVGNYVRKLGDAEATQSLLREALKESQVAHWKRLQRAAIALRDKFRVDPNPLAIKANWREAFHEGRDFLYLTEALAKDHLPDHAAWDWLNRWEKQVKALRGARQEALAWVEARLGESWPWPSPGNEAREALLKDWLMGIRGDRPQEPEEDERIDGFALRREQWVIAKLPRQEAQRARGAWKDLLAALCANAFTSAAREAWQCLLELEPQVEERIERLGLIEAFPGECEFCPLRTPQRRARRSRGGSK